MDNRSEVNANVNHNHLNKSNIAMIDQITDLHHSLHNSIRTKQNSAHCLNINDDGLLNDFINMNSQEYKSEMTKLSQHN